MICRPTGAAAFRPDCVTVRSSAPTLGVAGNLRLDVAWVTGHTAGEREVRLPGSRQIRPARGADAEALFALACQLAASFVPERAAFELSLRRILADPSAWLGVAEEEGAVSAYCLGFDHFTFYANGRVAWVEEIAVRADSRRRGVGTALMAAFEDWARSRGVRLVALATRRAAPFYTALGYEESATYFRKLL